MLDCDAERRAVIGRLLCLVFSVRPYIMGAWASGSVCILDNGLILFYIDQWRLRGLLSEDGVVPDSDIWGGGLAEATCHFFTGSMIRWQVCKKERIFN